MLNSFYLYNLTKLTLQLTHQILSITKIGCVSPKSLCGVDNDDLRRSEIRNQSSIVSKVVQRLISETAFENHGWKRKPGKI